jgi:hypothetical protein
MTKGITYHVSEEAKEKWEAEGAEPRKPVRLDCESLGACKNQNAKDKEKEDEKSGK